MVDSAEGCKQEAKFLARFGIVGNKRKSRIGVWALENVRQCCKARKGRWCERETVEK